MRSSLPHLPAGFWPTLALVVAVAWPGLAVAQPCSPTGDFAARIALPVSWRGGVALRGGEGEVTYLTLVTRAVADASGELEEAITVCSTSRPATQLQRHWGGERYATAYDAAELALAGPLAPAPATFAPSGPGGADYVSGPIAYEVGVRLPGGAEATWPDDLTSLRPHLLPATGGQLGATAHSRGDDGFVAPPIDNSLSRRASVFLVANRTVVRHVASWQGCDALQGESEICEAAGGPGLDSMLVGCHTTDGGDCSLDNLSLANSKQPRLRPLKAGSFEAARLPAGATCAEVLAHFRS